MTRNQLEILLRKEAQLVADIDELDAVITDRTARGSASASLSSGGGSKSYTNWSVESLIKVREYKIKSLKSVRRSLAGGGGLPGVSSVMTVRI